MKIAYGGGLTLSLYPVEKPLEILKNALDDNPRYIIEEESDFISVSYTAKFIRDFFELWRERLKGEELDLFEEILKNICFETRLNNNGYFDAIITVKSEIDDKIHEKIYSNPRIKNGFFDELKSHFKDLYEAVYKKNHQHTYIRYYEIFCHLIIIDDENFDLNDAKEIIYNYYNNKLLNNIIKPTMNNMDSFESQIRNQNFLDFLSNDVRHFIRYCTYISNRAIYLRRNVWAMNYIKMCLNPSMAPIEKKDLFLKNLEGSVGLLTSRKEVIESIKDSIAYHMSFASTLLGFFGVMIAILLSNPNLNGLILPITAIFILILLSLLLFVMFNSIKNECRKPKLA